MVFTRNGKVLVAELLRVFLVLYGDHGRLADKVVEKLDELLHVERDLLVENLVDFKALGQGLEPGVKALGPAGLVATCS